MIFNTDLKMNKMYGYETTIKNIEKSLEILDERFRNKTISNQEYIEKSKKLRADLEKYKNLKENNM